MTRSISVAKRVRVFHHLQYATHHGAAALRVVVQQAQSAQSFLVPQPVLRRVQHTVAAQHLQHTDKPRSGTSAALKSRHTETRTQSIWLHTHTPSESPIHFHLPVSVFSPLVVGSIDLSPGPLFQDKCLRHTINNLSANQTLYIWQLLSPPWRNILMKPLGWNLL